MTVDDAQFLHGSANVDEDGVFVRLRLGEDPGKARIIELQKAIKLLWMHWKDQSTLPFQISAAAARIVHLAAEADSNLRQAVNLPRPAKEIKSDARNLAQCAFHLLCGPEAEYDIGPNGKYWSDPS